jgi:hypothetical protein
MTRLTKGLLGVRGWRFETLSEKPAIVYNSTTAIVDDLACKWQWKLGFGALGCVTSRLNLLGFTQVSRDFQVIQANKGKGIFVIKLVVLGQHPHCLLNTGNEGLFHGLGDNGLVLNGHRV